jgi:hypothetical protein
MSAVETQAESRTSVHSGAIGPLLVWSGVLFVVLAVVLYAILRQMLIELPAARSGIDELRTNAPALTRLMIVGAGGAFSNFVSLVLFLSGYLASDSRRLGATLGMLFSGSLLLVLFSIVFASLLIG